MLICTKTPALSGSALQSVCEMCLTICLVLLSRWFPGSHICPLIRSHWRRELWCPQAQQGLTTYSPGCCRTLLGIQGWLLNPRCLVTYRHTLPQLVRNRWNECYFYYFIYWFCNLTSWPSWVGLSFISCFFVSIKFSQTTLFDTCLSNISRQINTMHTLWAEINTVLSLSHHRYDLDHLLIFIHNYSFSKPSIELFNHLLTLMEDIWTDLFICH